MAWRDPRRADRRGPRGDEHRDLRGRRRVRRSSRALREAGIEVTPLGPQRVRMVTHLDVDRAGCERAVVGHPRDLRRTGGVESIAVSTRTEYRTCPFCEATCGLEVTLDGDAVTRIRGDEDDVLSPRLHLPQGHRPEGAARGSRPAAHAAGARRRRDACVPRRGTRRWPRSTRGSRAILARGDRNAVAAYLGNPNAHNLDAMVYGARAAQGAGDQEHLLGLDRRPDAQAGLGRPDVRDDAQRARAGRGPHASTC